MSQKFTRRTFVASTLSACSLASGRKQDEDTTAPTDAENAPVVGVSSRRESVRPNILFVFSDQHRFDSLGCMDHPVARTPNLDRLAAEGVLFRRAYTNGPLCRPARASMMTGTYTHQHGVDHNLGVIANPQGPSHVRDLRANGYETGLVGKAHLYFGDNHPDNYKFLMDDWGFSSTVELVGPTEQTWRSTAYSEFLQATTPPGEEDKFQRWLDYNKQYTWTSPPPDVEPWNLGTEDHMDVFTAEKAIEWLENRESGRPFYLQLNFPGPHKPFDATSEFRDQFPTTDPALPEVISDPPTGDVSPHVEQLLKIKSEEWTDESVANLQTSYYAKVMLVDMALGRVLDAMEASGLLDNTWIIYCSDHGEMLADHSLTGKIVFFEGATRVPLIIRPPGGLQQGWVSDGLVDTVDVTATILELAGAKNPSLPGKSVAKKVMLGGDHPEANFHKTFVVSSNIGDAMIRSNLYKVCFDFARGQATEAYDLGNDPLERNNVVNDPDYREIVEEHVTWLMSEVANHPPLADQVDFDTPSGGSDTGLP